MSAFMRLDNQKLEAMEDIVIGMNSFRIIGSKTIDDSRKKSPIAKPILQKKNENENEEKQEKNAWL